MRFESAELFFLQIPLRLSITHGARADRTFSDSLVLRISARDGSAGYGEAVVRDYVSGPLGGAGDPRQRAARSAARLLAPLRGRDLGWHEILKHIAGTACDVHELPLLCAVETALLDLACNTGGKDIYSLIGREPARVIVRYGGTLPILSLDLAGKYLEICARFRFPNLKVKLGTDPNYNDAILSLCRKTLGEGFDIRADANAAWQIGDADAHLAACSRHGVRVIEQPFSVSALDLAAVASLAKERGFIFMADEGFLTASDISSIASSGAFEMLNLRLSKNGGLYRVFALAEDAEKNGLSYQLGCMVGETGILSALGRVAASLLANPVYVEGGYDDILLSENITLQSFGFGPGGEVPVVRGHRIGFEVDEKKLARLSVEALPLSQY